MTLNQPIPYRILLPALLGGFPDNHYTVKDPQNPTLINKAPICFKKYAHRRHATPAVKKYLHASSTYLGLNRYEQGLG